MENDLGAVLDALPGLLWTALPDGHVDFLGRRWREYTGLGVDDARGEEWLPAIHPDDRAETAAWWRAVLASGEPAEIEARLRRFDGEYRWFLVRTRPMTAASGRVVGWCGVNTDIEDRRRAEEALRAREDRFRLVVDGLPAGVTLMTPAGELELVNRRVVEYLGKSLEQLQGWSTGDAVHPDDRPAVAAAWRRSIETGERYDVEQRIRRADGVYRWFRVSGSPVRDAEGRIVLWHLMQTDVDDRKRAEALLAGENRLLEMIASGRSLPDVLRALCGFVEEAAPECHCGVYPIDWSGPTFQSGVAPSLPPSYVDAVEGLPVRGEIAPCGIAACLHTQVIVEDIDSDPRWHDAPYREHVLAHGLRSVWSTPIYSLEGRVLGTFCLYRRQPARPSPRHQDLIAQVTHIASIAIERAQGEAALRRSEAFLAEAERLSATGSFSLDPATGAHWWSEQTYRIFGVDPAQPPTFEVMRERVHPDDLGLLEQAIACARRGEGFSTEFRLRMPDGTLKYLQVVAHAIAGATAGSFEFVGAVRDSTERRLSEEALSRARSELAHVARATSLGALTASIAHEVNQPLSGIITNASTCLRMLAADPPNVDGALETARRTIRDGHRASDVITRLRALFGKKDVAVDSVDLNEATREVIALSLSELRRGMVIVHAELADGLPPVVGDRVQLQQVILNLLRNAADAMSGVDDRARRLVISTERDGSDRVRLTVRDAGVGFEPDAADHLFDAFYTTKRDGMGIGLSVSRSIIESHRGRLWAAPNDGPGASFAFSIPRRHDGVPAPAADGLGAKRTSGPADAAAPVAAPVARGQ